MARDRIATKKSAMLARLSERGDEDFQPLAKFNGEADDFYPIDDDFKTLKISSNSMSGVHPPPRKSKSRPSISPNLIMKYAESEDEDLSFAEDFDPHLFNADSVKMNQRKHNLLVPEDKFLPMTLSTVSPVRRKSLSDYGEDNTDTDITSEMDEDDFEEVDDIFGKEESGIYSSGGQKTSFANISKASQILTRKKQELQREAEVEEAELYERYKKQAKVPETLNTLKLKDLSVGDRGHNPHLDADALENERTVNYEYSRDDFESFEDGFDMEAPIKFEPGKLKQYQTSKGNVQLLHKMSMPTFPNSLRASKATRFRSTMDFGAVMESEHPVFNNSNKLIRKLDRMPSFHSRKAEKVKEFANDDELNYNMEVRKKQLLERYMEITEQQKYLKTSPKKGLKQLRHPGTKRKGVGLVKYLNDQSFVPATSASGKMKYNAESRRWEGNEHDLMRFDDAPGVKKQPSLITSKDFKQHNDKIKGNMMYDAENLRWVNLDKVDEEEMVFKDVPDLVPNDIPQYKQTETKPVIADRGVSTFTQRTTLTNSSGSSAFGRATVGDEFQLLAKLMTKFEKEEVKIRKKTHHWFGPNEHYKLDRPRAFKAEYFWEIRKMVVDDSNE